MSLPWNHREQRRKTLDTAQSVNCGPQPRFPVSRKSSLHSIHSQVHLPTLWPLNFRCPVLHLKIMLNTYSLAVLFSLVAQWCPALFEPRDYSPPGSSVHGILQARILEWVAISSSRGSSPPRDWTFVFCIGRQILCHWATREALQC